MDFIFRNGKLRFDDEFLPRIGMTKIIREDTEGIKEIDLKKFSLTSGEVLLELLEIKSLKYDCHHIEYDKVNLILKKCDMKLINELFELCNYLMIIEDDKVPFYISNYITELFVCIKKIEMTRCGKDYVKHMIHTIRKLFGIEHEDDVFERDYNSNLVGEPVEIIKEIEICEDGAFNTVPYYYNFTFLEEPVIWSKDTVKLFLKNMEDSGSYESVFAIVINIHPIIHSYFSKEEIKMGLDCGYFFTHTSVINGRFLGDEADSLSYHGNIELAIVCAKKGMTGFDSKELVEGTYKKLGVKGIKMILDNSSLFENIEENRELLESMVEGMEEDCVRLSMKKWKDD